MWTAPALDRLQGIHCYQADKMDINLACIRRSLKLSLNNRMTKLSKRLNRKKPCNCAKEAVKIIEKMVLDKNREHFITLTLNSRNVPIGVHIISVGTLNATLVHPREVFVEAINEKAATMIVAHNHPSGGLEPSEADVLLFGRLSDAGKILGIEVADSLIMDGNGNYIIM